MEVFDLAPDGKTIAFATNEAGMSKLYLFDTAARRARQVSGAPAGIIGTLRWHANGRELGFSLSSARSTSDVDSLDASDGTITRWTEGELGGLIVSTLSEPELIRWKSFDGLEITGFYSHLDVSFFCRGA